MTKSAFDIMDLVERELEDDDIDMVNDISDAKDIVGDIDDDIEEIYREMDTIHEKFSDDRLSIGDVNEFFDTDLPNIMSVLKGIRERLY